MTDTVKITMTDGTTREVHPDTHTTVDDFVGTVSADAAAEYGYTVNTVFEPVREDWTPYEPWMRDVLADDARVSWVGYVSASESRSPWLNCKPVSLDWLPDRDARIHPADVPERPAEPAPADVDPDEALGALIWRVVDDSDDESSYVTKAVAEEIGRAAREHIDNEPDDIIEEPPHEHVWKRRQNVTSNGYVMPAIEVCECDAARYADPADITEEPPVGSQVTDRESRAERVARRIEWDALDSDDKRGDHDTR